MQCNVMYGYVMLYVVVFCCVIYGMYVMYGMCGMVWHGMVWYGMAWYVYKSLLVYKPNN